ncbi:Uncharacterised protein [Aeromonas salmonicida]|nr:Uncharacterised protein [Aeromonas salmonicida]
MNRASRDSLPIKKEGQEHFSVTATVCVTRLDYKPISHSFYPPCYLAYMSLNRIKPINNAVCVNI